MLQLNDFLSQPCSKKNALDVMNYIDSDEEKFAELMDLFLNGESKEGKIKHRAGWMISHCCENNPSLVIPYLDALVCNLEKEKTLHNSIKRNTMKVLIPIKNIPHTLKGRLANLCFDYLADKNEAIAVRCNAMLVLYNIVQKEPELKSEFRMVIEEQLPFASAGFKSRARKILKQL